MSDVKRRTELYIVHALQALIPDHQFVPFTGGDESTDAVELEPPFTVVGIRDAEKVMATDGTWLCTGNLQVISHFSEATSQSHSILVKAIYIALANIQGVVEGDFIFHGIDVGTANWADDENKEAHADIINFTAGVDA